MSGTKAPDPAASEETRRLYVYNGGFFTQSRVKRILSLSGYHVSLGAPGPQDLVGVWGNSPTAPRGEAVAEHRGAGLLRVEDAWLRSVLPGRSGAPPCGLVLDQSGVHYDAETPSDLEHLLTTHPLDDTALLDRARGAIERLKEAQLSKYNAFDLTEALPEPGYVLVIDQTEDDASLRACGADRNRFLEMLFVAQDENPGMRIVVKSHPDTIAGHRPGHYTTDDIQGRISLCSTAVSPWALLDGAVSVYTVSSLMGFEAIYAGHKPRVFGTPFYAGWGLTSDEFPVQRRQRKLSRAQLFAGAALLYPRWYDPFAEALCSYETALENLAAETRAWREDHRGWVASGMRLWKREPLQRFFGHTRPVIFEDNPAAVRKTERPWMVWASKAAVGQDDALRVEDGFLRSRGLGAALVPPLSLVLDDLGIYYDAAKPSRLEALIAERNQLRPDQRARAERLITQIRSAGLSKYNVGNRPPALPDGHRILVVGQIEDDASLTNGSSLASTNSELLDRARADNPEAVIVYKPHPDFEAGLRDGGGITEDKADLVVRNVDPAALLDEVHELWTMTSLLGFEALLRGIPVTTLGVPFYAGWGLTTDLGRIPPRRRATPSLAGLVHASLIDYPRYVHPATSAPCPVEPVAEWLSQAEAIAPRGWRNRMLSKLQGLFASKAHLWR